MSSKRSFLRLPVEIHVDRLIDDFRAVPVLAWGLSHWDIHGSSDMLLLRGGTSGTEADFVASEVHDSPVLARMPYVASLIGAEGPFGQATYAFLFRMKAGGVAQPHTDDNPVWYPLFRIHVPIVTNDCAFLLSEGRAKHFAAGEAWTFDNQARHAVINGDAVRTHLILDVPPNPKLDALLNAATFDPGTPDPAGWQRTILNKPQRLFEPAELEAIPLLEKRVLGLDPEGFASRVRSVHPAAARTGADLRKGDIIVSVDAVSRCPVARTAQVYLRFNGEVGRTVTLGIVREGNPMTTTMAMLADGQDGNEG